MKTGVNHRSGKNRIGTYAQPLLSLLDTSFLATLPQRHLSNGFAEILKVALVKSETLFTMLERAGRYGIRDVSWSHVFTVNLDSPFALAQEAARTMVAAGRGGRIVNVTSVHEHIPIAGGSAYCAAKSALGMLTRTMALELGEHGITVVSVAPGETATPMNGHDPAVDPATVARPVVPAGRPRDPREVADLIRWLVSGRSAYVTGQSFVVDGGLSLIAADANVRSVLGEDAVGYRGRRTGAVHS
ncbi:SDR family oxidoreductase [Streptomyces sp. NPDC051132]|uniref:SDR family oxidoreductase n=1 Tax=unclassified Streptomyces TaxID=2593676 RepID=UPI003416D62C